MSQFILVPESRDAVPYLASGDPVGVDTEFMRERTFFAELCLVQIAAGEALLCVDPLLNDDQAAFWQSLADVDWVVHSARQDIEVIYQTEEIMPRALFDTQIAAGLAGHPAQLGYAGLVKELFDVELPKSHTRANWAARPLPEALLEYAAEDVEYLLPARDTLVEELDSLGRLDWAFADSALLLDPDLYTMHPDRAIDRVKGARNFRGRRRNAAAKLAAWRESRAIQRNKPRQWILKDSALLEIAYQLPESKRALRDVPDMPPKVAERFGDTLLDIVDSARREDDGYRPPRAPDEAQKALLKRMQDKVAGVASELGLANEIVASKKELAAAIMQDDRDSRVFRDWRRELVGEELLALL